MLRADGIALSTDGVIWTTGAGDYGRPWDQAGIGVSVQQGGTLYIKYHSFAPDAMLRVADHGRGSTGQWHAIGPALTGGIGGHPNEPVVLRITKAGTAESAVAWVNGRERSGIWSGIPATGPYDLALHEGATWSGPAIVVTDAPRKPGFWRALFGPSNLAEPTESTSTVPDGGGSALLFAIAALCLAGLRRLTR